MFTEKMGGAVMGGINRVAAADLWELVRITGCSFTDKVQVTCKQGKKVKRFESTFDDVDMGARWVAFEGERVTWLSRR